ncbi:MAG: photosystem II biogenesis protein Psp29 [Synechococcus sp.]
MGEHLTIADSKRAFHSAFPHVIPSLYRRTADELLVELHLLSHQKQFKVDALFAVGLRQVFDAFTRGYRPEAHLEPLFSALCSCNGFDAAALNQLAHDSELAVQGHSVEDVQQWLRNKGSGAPDAMAKVLERADDANFHYSRLMAVGLLTLLAKAQGAEGSNPSELAKVAHDLSEPLGLTKERVEKDLSLYTGNLERMAQAVELMEETLAAERRKRERQNDASAMQETPAETVTN